MVNEETEVEDVVNEETEVEDMVNEETEVEEEVDIDVGVNEGVEGEATDFVDEDYIARDDEDLYDTCVNNADDVEGGVSHNKGKNKDVAEENDDVNEDVENERVVLDEETCENISDFDGSDSDVEKRPKYKQFRAETDMADPIFVVGMKFSTVQEFRKAVWEYGIKNGHNFDFIKNETDRVRVRCAADGCDWLLYASLVNRKEKTMQIKTYQKEHKCGRVFRNTNLNSRVLANRYVDKFRSNPEIPVKAFMSDVYYDLNSEVTLSQAYRAKTKAMKIIQGSHIHQYGKLWDYCAELKKQNSGSSAVLKVELNEKQQPIFQRIYICLHACKEGFKAGYRPLIGLDECHVKGPYPEQILSAVGIDANNQMFPIAYAVVESECKDSWSWFIDLLMKDLQIVNTHGWTFITDK